MFYAVSAIFQPYNVGDYYLKVISFEMEVSLAALPSLYFLRAKGV